MYHDSLIFRIKTNTFRIEKWNQIIGVLKLKKNKFVNYSLSKDKMESDVKYILSKGKTKSDIKRKTIEESERYILYKYLFLFEKIKNNSFEHYSKIKKYYDIMTNMKKTISFLDEIIKSSNIESNDALASELKNDKSSVDFLVKFNKLKNFENNLFWVSEKLVEDHFENLNSLSGQQKILTVISFLKKMINLKNKNKKDEIIRILKVYPHDLLGLLLYFQRDRRDKNYKKKYKFENKDYVRDVLSQIEIIEGFDDNLFSTPNFYEKLSSFFYFLKDQVSLQYELVKSRIKSKKWFKNSNLINF